MKTSLKYTLQCSELHQQPDTHNIHQIFQIKLSFIWIVNISIIFCAIFDLVIFTIET